MKRKPIALMILCLMLFVCFSAPGLAETAELPEKIPIYFFHETACGSCDGTTEFVEMFNEVVGENRQLHPYDVSLVNVFPMGGRQRFEALMDEYGLSRENLFFPLVVIHSKVFAGMENIRTNINEAFLTAGQDIFEERYVYLPSEEEQGLFDRYEADPAESTLVYFYRITCEECGQTKPVIEGLPETVEIDGEVSPVRVISFNTRSGNHSERIRAFFESYQVAEQDQMVPIVFLRDRYFAGFEQISDGLTAALEQGDGLNFAYPEP